MIKGDISAAGSAIMELTQEYEKMYGFKDVNGFVQTIRNDDELEHYQLCLVLDGQKGVIKACVQANAYQIEDVAAARGLLAKLHQQFIYLLYRKVKDVIW